MSERETGGTTHPIPIAPTAFTSVNVRDRLFGSSHNEMHATERMS